MVSRLVLRHRGDDGRRSAETPAAPQAGGVRLLPPPGDPQRTRAILVLAVVAALGTLAVLGTIVFVRVFEHVYRLDRP